MIAFLLSPLGKIVGAAGIVVLAFIGFRLWLAAHDQSVLSGYVSLVEKQAADAKAAEAQRQADASKAAVDTLNTQLASVKAAEAKASADLETRISSYEQQLAAAHRDCLADDADVDFILHDSQPAPDGLGHH